MADAVTILIDALTQPGTDLYALVEDRVQSPIAPPEDAWQNEEPAVLLQRLEMTEEATSGVFRLRVLFKCFGGSDKPEDARAVCRALVTTLSNERIVVSDGTVLWSRLSGSVNDTVNDDTGWYMTSMQMTVMVQVCD